MTTGRAFIIGFIPEIFIFGVVSFIFFLSSKAKSETKFEVNRTYFKWFDITVVATTATRQPEGE